MMSKSELRDIFTKRRAQAFENACEYRRAEDAVIANLLSSPMWQEADIILSYCSTRGELDLRPVWDAARAADKIYAIPKTLTGVKEGKMIFSQVNSAKDLIKGRFGIFEPSSDLPPLNNIQTVGHVLCIVPGLAFDEKGYRLGYGGGYYDRFLEKFHGISVGLVLSACKTARLPRDIHDIAVSYVIDERQVTCTNASTSIK